MSEVSEQSQRRYLERLMGVTFTEGNSVRALNNGKEIFPAMLEAIQQARTSVNLLTYIYWKGRVAQAFADALSERARSGVKVRVLLDAIGAKEMDQSLIRQLKAGGAEVEWFRPVNWRLWNADNRTHRKILICDDTVGFTGGVGIASQWEGDARNPDEWRDMHFELRGPCLAGLAGAFWDNWIETVEEGPPYATDIPPLAQAGSSRIQVLRSSSVSGGSDAAVLLLGLIEMAKSRIDLVTPYLVLDKTYLGAIGRKAEAGVRIRLLLPGEHIDKRFERVEAERYFEPLLSSGVEIYRYQKTMLHTKLLLVDQNLAALGSMNLNRRSIRKDEEVVLVIQDRDQARSLRENVEADLGHADRVREGDWKLRSPVRNGLRFGMRLFRKQL